MANTPSTSSSMSPKQNLPPSFSLVEEGNSSRTREFATTLCVSPTCFQKIVAELLGTYMLIFAGCGAALTDRKLKLTILGIALVWGFSLMALIFTFGHILVHISIPQSPLLLLCQFMFWLNYWLPILASLTLRVLFNYQGDVIPMTTQYFVPITDLEAITREFIITFFLMFTICGAATDDRAKKELSGVDIGVTLLFIVLIAGPITGASMNPTRSIGPAVVAGVYKNLWVFIIAPILGATTAALIYNLLRLPKTEKREESTKSIYNDLYMHSSA